MKIQPNNKLLMIGDSITDCGRTRPIADSHSSGLGNGYVSLIDGLLNATDPQLGIGVINMGVGGDTVRELKSRWQTDVLNLQPDWLSIFIGINDVWRHFDGLATIKDQVTIEEYEATLVELIQQTRPYLQGLVLMTPYFIEPNRQEPMRKMMDQYGNVVHHLAKEFQAILVDTQAALDTVLAHLPPAALSSDRVRPNLTGHLLLARAFLKAVDYSW